MVYDWLKSCFNKIVFINLVKELFVPIIDYENVFCGIRKIKSFV